MAAPVLITCESLTKAFGARPLFADLSFSVHEGDHIGLVGPNGAGKSTLLKILAGLEVPDEGSCTRRRNLRVGHVPQHPSFEPGKSAEALVAEALEFSTAMDPVVLTQRVSKALSQVGFTRVEMSAETLSGGWRTRLAIARALVLDPELLLLDEPTNHLDLESRLWLEGFLNEEARAFIVVSHDRYFLQNVGHRMFDIDRVYAQGLLTIDGTYADLLEKRDAVLRTQASYEESLANRVRREVEWLRRGAKARTRKSKARIDAAHGSIEELADARARGAVAPVGLELTASARQTKRLWSCQGLGKSYGERPIVKPLDLLLTPGMRLGVVGANGSGKTTLLRLIVGELVPDEGAIHRADGLRVVYFDQNRATLDPGVTLKRALAPDGDAVVYRDTAVHVASWAKRFQFRAEQLETPVGRLSGGERARVLMARLMLQPADLLVLDEPTNDLDIPTLEVLEESLLGFPGALVLVTHDRHLLDRVVTQVLALDGSGNLERFAEYAQWVAFREVSSASKSEKVRDPFTRPASPKPKKLTYREQHEWDGMEERVLAAETHLAETRTRVEDPAVASDAAALQERLAALAAAEQEVDGLYTRWAELETKISEANREHTP